MGYSKKIKCSIVSDGGGESVWKGHTLIWDRDNVSQHGTRRSEIISTKKSCEELKRTKTIKPTEENEPLIERV